MLIQKNVVPLLAQNGSIITNNHRAHATAFSQDKYADKGIHLNGVYIAHGDEIEFVTDSPERALQPVQTEEQLIASNSQHNDPIRQALGQVLTPARIQELLATCNFPVREGESIVSAYSRLESETEIPGIFLTEDGMVSLPSLPTQLPGAVFWVFGKSAIKED